MQQSGPTRSKGTHLRIAWTTVETTTDAESLAREIMDSHLAACVQMDSPVRSMFRWKGKLETSEEIRLWVKYPAGNEEALQRLVNTHHPYEVPQWVSVDAETMARAYGEWALSTMSGD